MDLWLSGYLQLNSSIKKMFTLSLLLLAIRFMILFLSVLFSLNSSHLKFYKLFVFLIISNLI